MIDLEVVHEDGEAPKARQKSALGDDFGGFYRWLWIWKPAALTPKQMHCLSSQWSFLTLMSTVP